MPLEEHFVWLSSDDTPYENDPGSAFIPPDFTLGLTPVRNWPHRARSPPWVLDPEEYPKPDLEVPDDSAVGTSLDSGKKKKKKKKKKKHRHSRKSEDLELKVTNRGVGADTPIWSTAASSKGSDLCGPIYVSSCRQTSSESGEIPPDQRSETSASLHGGLPQVGSGQP